MTHILYINDAKKTSEIYECLAIFIDETSPIFARMFLICFEQHFSDM